MGEGLCIAAKRHHRQDGKPCAKDKCHDDRPQAGQNALQQGNVLVPAVDVGQERYKEQRRGDAAQRCDDGSGHLRDPQSHKGRRVDRNGAGGHLRDRDKVGELLHGQPAVLLHHLTLDQRNGGVAAAHTEHPHLQKAEKKLNVDHFAPPFFHWASARTTPNAAAARMTTTTLT